MSSISFTNKNEEVGFSFNSHGCGRINLAPGETLTVELPEVKGPYIQSYLEAFYARYSEYISFTVSIDGASSEGTTSGISEADADAKYAQKTEVYSKDEIDAKFSELEE